MAECKHIYDDYGICFECDKKDPAKGFLPDWLQQLADEATNDEVEIMLDKIEPVDAMTDNGE